MSKVILTKDVKGLGKKDSVVEVSDGYARNYLLPRGIAVEATALRLNEVKKKEEAIKNKEAKDKAKAVELSEKISHFRLIIKAKTGENGRLFGSITSADISNELKKQYSVDIDKKKIILAEPIKQVCDIKVEARLYPGITGSFTVVVEGIE